MEQIIFVLLFVLSLLNIFLRFFTEYSHRVLWQLSVLTSEYGHFFAVGTFVFWLAILVFAPPSRWWRSRRWLVPLSILFFLYPLGLALTHQARWERGIETVFGPGPYTAMRWIQLDELLTLREPRVPQAYKTFSYQVSTGAKKSQTLDYYGGQENAPLVVVVHGGGWSSGDSQQLPELNLVLARKGFHVASVNYSLIPENPWPSQKNDVVDAIEWMRANVSSLKFNPDKIFLLGRSAGGHIAGVVANQRRDLGIIGLISYYAPTDLDFGFVVADENDIIDSRDLIRQLHGGDPLQKPIVFEDTSILKAVTANSPPTLILHGGSDSLVWYKHSERWDRLLDAAKVKHFFVRLPWATHGFDYNLHGPGGQIATNAVLHFLDRLAPVQVDLKK